SRLAWPGKFPPLIAAVRSPRTPRTPGSARTRQPRPGPPWPAPAGRGKPFSFAPLPESLNRPRKTSLNAASGLGPPAFVCYTRRYREEHDMMIRKCLLAAALAFPAAPALAANYTLAVEPNYPPAQAEMVYQPLLDYLSASTGHTFRLKTASNYHVYWRDLRAGMKVDFAFEEAHFAGYRMGRLG